MEQQGRRRWLLRGLTIAMLGLVAMEPPHGHTIVEFGEHVEFEFEIQHGLCFPRWVPSTMRKMQVLREDAPGKEVMIWEVRGTKDSEVERIRYGVAPEGWETVTVAEPLVPGVQYIAFGWRGSSGGRTRFELP